MVNQFRSIKSWVQSHLKGTNIPLFVFLLTLLFMGLISWNIFSPRPSPKAVNGYLYCSSIDNRYPVMLSGKWEYYKNAFLFPSDFNYLGDEKSGRIPMYIQVPGPAPNPYGFGTYRLAFKFITYNQLFALKTADIRSSARIYIDGVPIGTIGDPSTLTNGSIPWNSSQFIVFPMDTLRSVHEIIIHTSNYNYFKGGITSPLYFGTQVEVYQLSNQAKLAESIAVMSIFVLATFLIFLLPLHIQMGNMKYLLFFTLCFGLFFLATGEKLLLQSINMDYYIAFTRFTLSLYVLMSLFMTLYMNVQAGQTKLKRWLFLYSIIGAVLVLGVLFSRQFMQSYLVKISTLFIVLSSLFSAVHMFLQLLKRNLSALYQMLGLICWSSLLGVYYAYSKGILPNTDRNVLLVLLSFGFVVLQIMYISRHIVSIYSANERLAKRMVISDKLKIEFMEIASHELRTPLHGIINIAQSVLEKLGNEKGKAMIKNHSDLELVVHLAHRMSGIVNDIYQFVNSSGNSSTSMRPTDLHLEVEAVLEVFGYTSNIANIRFINHISPKASIVYADDRKLWQVLTNLIGNAVKYTDSGTITVESRLVENSVYVSVTDTGIGMPVDRDANIFDKSVRLTSGIDRAEGLGLGLYITRKLVEDMKGEIFVEWTEPLIGTRITFTLAKCDKDVYSRMRLEEREMRSAEMESQPEILNMLWHSNAHILMADDNPDNLKIVSDMFYDTSITIDTVQDGQSAINLLEKNNYDIIILDVMMPGMSGFEVCREIRKRYSIFELPVLMLTARDASEDIITGFWAGANDYVIKPVDSVELRARVFTLIALKQSVSTAIKNELSFLQAQIRPHFLYNAFNTISAIALSDGAFASELIDDLSIYLRHCFRSDVIDDLVTIDDEIELVNAYLRIESARFGERLQISMDMKTNLHFSLPPLTIQPIVENAVRHGSLDSYNSIKIQINLFQDGNDAVIEVTDNGRGIDVNKIQSLLDGNMEDRNSGVGLLNVNRRLKLRYNRTLKIENISPSGTRVTISIPLSSYK